MSGLTSYRSGRVYGRFATGLLPNGKPMPARGSVSFTAEVPYLPYPGAEAITFLRYTLRGVLDDQGNLCEPLAEDPRRPGSLGVPLLATNDPQTAVQEWTWTARPRFLDEDGKALLGTIEPFSFFLPAGADLDLTNVLKVPSSPGVGTSQAEAAVALAEVAAERSALEAIDAQEAATRSADQSALAQASATTSSRKATSSQEAATASATSASHAHAAATASANSSAVAQGQATASAAQASLSRASSEASADSSAQAQASARQAAQEATRAATEAAHASDSALDASLDAQDAQLSAVKSAEEAQEARAQADRAKESADLGLAVKALADAGKFKGEAGGWNSGTDLGVLNLDEIFVPGLYRQWNANNATVASGYPTASSPGVLRVSKWSGEPNGVLQEFTKLGSGGVVTSTERPRITYKRYYGNKWSAWTASVPTKVEYDGTIPGVKRAWTWDELSNTFLPLGLALPNTIPSTVESFDNLKAPGLYQWNQTTHANTPPIQAYGTLEVIVSSTTPTRIIQTFYPGTTAAQSRVFYQRTYVDGAQFGWYPWRAFTSQRVDNTAGRAVYTWDDVANREQLIYGDTGWRNIAALLPPTWTAASIRMRRTGQSVTVAFDSLTGTESGHSTFLLALPGFTADSTVSSNANQRYGPVGELGGTGFRWVSPQPGNGDLRVLNYVANMKLHGTVTYFTADPWPTALPGTSSGPMPASN